MIKSQKVEVIFIIKGKRWKGSCQFDALREHTTKERQFFQLSNGRRKLMGVHVYRQGPEITVRVTNGIYTERPFTGPVFYQTMGITIDDEEVYSVMRPSSGEHVMLPLAQFHKRFMTRNGALTDYRYDSLYEIKDWPILKPEWSDWYAEHIENRTFTMYTCMKSEDAIPSQYFYSPKMGPFKPWYLGDSGAGAPGGWGIYPTPYLTTSKECVELAKLEHQAMLDRHWVHMYDSNGDHIFPNEFVSNGVQTEWFYSIGGYFGDNLVQQNVPSYYKSWPSAEWTVGNCQYLGHKYQGGLRDYEYIDDAHLSRVTGVAKYLAMVAGDEVAKDDMVSIANWVMLTWTDKPISGYYKDIANTVYNISNGPKNQGAYIERSFGWASDAIFNAAKILEFNEYESWLYEAFIKMLSNIVMENGLYMNQTQGTHLHEVATQAGMPHEYGVSGSIYVPIVNQGVSYYGSIEGLVDKSIEVLHRRGYELGPAYYMGVSKNGAILSRTEGAWGPLEGFNGWWNLALHSSDKVFKELGSKYVFNAGSLAGTIDKLFQEAMQGAVNRLPNAVRFIGRAQRV